MDGATGEGSARIQHQYKVDPNHVRVLAPGAAYIISRGRAMKGQIAQAPQLTTPLPHPDPVVGESSEGAPGEDPRDDAGAELTSEQGHSAGRCWGAGSAR